MNRVPDDSELLELIEGGLNPAREREVRALLATDPDLARRVSQMMMQRSMLHQLGEDREPVGRDLAGAAVSASINEEMRRMVDRGRGVGVAQGGTRRPGRGAMLAAASLGVLFIGGWVWFLVGRVGPEGSLTRPRNFTPKYRDIVRDHETGTVENRDVTLPLPEAIDRVAATAMGRGDVVTPNFVGPLADGQRVEFDQPPAKLAGQSSLLDQWMSRLDHADSPSVSLDRAVELARAGKLRIIVTGKDPSTLKQRVVRLAESKGGFMPGEIAASTPEDNTPPAPTTLANRARGTLALALPMGVSPALVREAIESVVSSVTGDGAGAVRFDEVPPMETISEDLSAADLLWWSRPSDQWRTRPIVRVPVVIESLK